MNKPSIGLKVKPEINTNQIIPTQCPKCKSNNIIGRTMVIGMAYVNLEIMNVDELGDDFEVCDKDNLLYRCFECENDWE
jgi:3-isopropylmalate dehydratase small subunit